MGIHDRVSLFGICFDPNGIMRVLPYSIQELISTPTRKEIFKTINRLKDGFTYRDICLSLEKGGLKVGKTSVQNFVKALTYRGYLKEYSLKESNSAGRSTTHYKRVK